MHKKFPAKPKMMGNTGDILLSESELSRHCCVMLEDIAAGQDTMRTETLTTPHCCCRRQFSYPPQTPTRNLHPADQRPPCSSIANSVSHNIASKNLCSNANSVEMTATLQRAKQFLHVFCRAFGTPKR